MISTNGSDQGRDPRTGAPVGAPVPHTSSDEVGRVAGRAAAAAPAFAARNALARAGALRAVASALDGARAELVALADAETGLGAGRLDGEVTRTAVQLEMFADAVSDGALLEVIIDPADPGARPAARPDLRRMLVPIGPVAVFAAGNFPFAFSVAGGDTASALAGGNPVVVKAHPGHPGTSVRTGEIVAAALSAAGAPAGTFAVVHGFEAGRTLAAEPAIAAVGFTGSVRGGRALLELVNARPVPVPFYGELGSLNPVVVTPGAVAARGEEIAHGFVGSYTLGSGQFCTKPGLVLLPAGHGLTEILVRESVAVELGPLLGPAGRDGYTAGAQDLLAVPGARSLLAGTESALADASTVDGYRVPVVLVAIDAARLLAGGTARLKECFGPAAVVVEYDSETELFAVLEALDAALTATLHADAATEPELARRLLDRLSTKAGRVIWGGWPTGVAVAWAQHHGGPWPATTASVHTSVGMTAARRFLRPVAYQNVPDELLPEPLRDANRGRRPARREGDPDH